MPTTYVVHAEDPTTNQRTERMFEADSSDEARASAEAIGLRVLAIEVLEPNTAAANDPFSGGPASAAPPVDEAGVWSGSPSQWTNFWWFALCVLIIPIPWAVWQILKTANTKFNLSSQRLQLEQGVFSKSLEEIELYRIKDTELTRSFVQRILGLGTVVVLSSDTTMPRMEIPSIKGPQDLRDQIRDNVELVRKRRGVRELDVN